MALKNSRLTNYYKSLQRFQADWSKSESEAVQLLRRLSDQIIQHDTVNRADWTDIEAAFPSVKELLLVKITGLINAELSDLLNTCSSLERTLNSVVAIYDKAESELESVLLPGTNAPDHSLITLADMVHSQFKYRIVARKTSLKIFNANCATRDKLIETIAETFAFNKECSQVINELLGLLAVASAGDT